MKRRLLDVSSADPTGLGIALQHVVAHAGRHQAQPLQLDLGRHESHDRKDRNNLTEDILARVNEHILDHGHAVQFVGGTPDQRPFGYTVGRTLRKRPELLISGPFPPAITGEILNEAVRVDDAEPIEAGRIVTITTPGGPIGWFPLEIGAEPLITARATFGPKVEALQLVWPDDEGNFPWQENCKLTPGGQTIYIHE